MPGGASLETYADAVAGLIGALDLDRPHLCGLSFGGGLAVAVLRRHPRWRATRLSRTQCR